MAEVVADTQDEIAQIMSEIEELQQEMNAVSNASQTEVSPSGASAALTDPIAEDLAAAMASETSASVNEHPISNAPVDSVGVPADPVGSGPVTSDPVTEFPEDLAKELAQEVSAQLSTQESAFEYNEELAAQELEKELHRTDPLEDPLSAEDVTAAPSKSEKNDETNFNNLPPQVALKSEPQSEVPAKVQSLAAQSTDHPVSPLTASSTSPIEEEDALLKEFTGASDEPWLEETLAHLQTETSSGGMLDDTAQSAESNLEKTTAPFQPGHNPDKSGRSEKSEFQESLRVPTPASAVPGSTREISASPSVSSAAPTRPKSPLKSEEELKNEFEDFFQESESEEYFDSEETDPKPEAHPSNYAGQAGSLSMKVQGNMSIRLHYGSERQSLQVRFQKENILIELPDGSELKIPIRQKNQNE